MSDLRDTLDEIDDLDLEDAFEEEDDQEGPEEAGVESPPAEDEPELDPTDEEADEEEPEEEASPDEGAPDDAEGEPEEVEEGVEEDEDAEPTYNIDGEEVPLSEVLEWRDGQKEIKARLTQKSQEWAERERQYQAALQQANEGTKAQRKLVQSLTNDGTVKKFLKKHPEALELLLQEPEEAKKLIGDPELTNAFWSDYETLQENPRLAQRLVGADSGEADTEEVSDEVVRERNIRIASQVWQGVEQAVDAIIEEREIEDEEGQHKEAVLESLLTVFGVPTDGSATEQDVFAGTSRALNMMFRNDPQHGTILERRMLDERFDLIEAKQKTKKDRAAKKAEQHNAEVDAALEQETKPPKTPSGDGPTAPPETLPEPEGDGIRGIMDAIDDLDIEV